MSIPANGPGQVLRSGAACEPTNKAKIARRVVEVLDYFDDEHREATVMDIVRRYGRPQSSTSELLSGLVDLGLLHKDANARSYSLTARAALIGIAAQPDILREGRLIRLVDRLVAQTGLTVAVFGTVRSNVQVLTLRHGGRALPQVSAALFGGMQAPLTQSAAGMLLLGGQPRARCEGLVRRLNAEAPDTDKFNQADMMARIDAARTFGHCRGDVGFGIAAARMVAVSIPDQPAGRSMAIGAIHKGDGALEDSALLDTLLGELGQLTPREPEAIGHRASTAEAA